MRTEETEDFYARLGVERDASPGEIRSGFRKMARKWHPDVNPENQQEATRQFIAVSEAYEVLSNPEKKVIYDGTGVVVSFITQQEETVVDEYLRYQEVIEHFSQRLHKFAKRYGGFEDIFGGSKFPP